VSNPAGKIKKGGKKRGRPEKWLELKNIGEEETWTLARLAVNLLRCSCENILQYSALNFCHVSAIRGRPLQKLTMQQIFTRRQGAGEM